MPLVVRIGLAALILGTCSAVVATERITATLVLTAALSFLVVPVLLLAGAACLIGGGAGYRVPALVRYLDAYRPWWAWFLAVSALLLLVPALRPHSDWLLLTAAAPLGLTTRGLARFCRTDLALDPAATGWRLATHHAVTYGLLLAAAAAAVAVWPRVLGAFA